MKQHTEFINIYKELEKVLATVPVKDFEDTLSEDDAQKLRLCRNIRNYIQHHADYERFVAINPGMCTFLSDMVNRLMLKDGAVKDIMISSARYSFLNDSQTIAEAAAIMTTKKDEEHIVLDKKGAFLGILTKSLISDLFGKGELQKNTKISKYKDALNKNIFMVPSTMPYTQFEEECKSHTSCKCALVLNKNKICGVVKCR